MEAMKRFWRSCAHLQAAARLDLGVQELSEVGLFTMGKFRVPETNYRIDLTITRSGRYYTGTVYETTFNRHPEIGICSGRRYDNLAEFTQEKLPGVVYDRTDPAVLYSERFEYLNRSLATSANVLMIKMTDDMQTAVEFLQSC